VDADKSTALGYSYMGCCTWVPARPAVNITVPGGNYLYSGQSNLITLRFTTDTFNTVLVTAPNNNVYSYNRYYHQIKSPVKGPLLVSVFDTAHGRRVLLAQKRLQVIPPPASLPEAPVKKPSATISGYTSGDIPLSVLLQAKKIDTDSAYKIVQAVLVTNGREGFAAITNTGAGFSNNTVSFIWPRLQAGCTLTFEHIYVVNNRGEIQKVPPLALHVVAG
jgi:hypothetical protein